MRRIITVLSMVVAGLLVSTAAGVDTKTQQDFEHCFQLLGNPKFHVISSTEKMNSVVTRYFNGLGATIVGDRNGADLGIAAVGKFMPAENDDGDRGVKLSMEISITERDSAKVLCGPVSGVAESFQEVAEERRREIVVEKAFAKMEGQLLKELKTMAARITDGQGASGVSGAAPGINPRDIELVIMEEPFSLGQMKVAAAFGTELGGARFFYQNYTVLQRKVRDLIVGKADEAGFAVKLLEGNDAYEQFLTKDATLVGFYYNVETDKFEVDRDLLKEVKSNNPDALILYYRFDSLVYDSGSIRVSVALNLVNPGNNKRKTVGSFTVDSPAKSAIKDAAMDEIANAATEAVEKLWLTGRCGPKLLRMAKEIAAGESGGPSELRLNVNAAAFDEKIRKRAMYELSKKLVQRGVCRKEDIKRTNDALRSKVADKTIGSAEELYMEYLLPMLEELGVTVTDEQVNYQGRELTIKPGK